MSSKPLRETMPLISAWIDDLRSAFGAELINTQIRRGIAGEPTFYASEGGAEIGTAMPVRPTLTFAQYQKLGAYKHPADKEKGEA